MTQPLRIVRVMPFFEPATRFGGSVTHARETSGALARRGHAVRIVTSDLGIEDGIPRDTWVRRNGYEVYYAAARGCSKHPPYYPPAGALRALSAILDDADVL